MLVVGGNELARRYMKNVWAKPTLGSLLRKISLDELL